MFGDRESSFVPSEALGREKQVPRTELIPPERLKYEIQYLGDSIRSETGVSIDKLKQDMEAIESDYIRLLVALYKELLSAKKNEEYVQQKREKGSESPKITSYDIVLNKDIKRTGMYTGVILHPKSGIEGLSSEKAVVGITEAELNKIKNIIGVRDEYFESSFMPSSDGRPMTEKKYPGSMANMIFSEGLIHGSVTKSRSVRLQIESAGDLYFRDESKTGGSVESFIDPITGKETKIM